jgi:hypothetical protein
LLYVSPWEIDPDDLGSYRLNHGKLLGIRDGIGWVISPRRLYADADHGELGGAHEVLEELHG